MIKKYSLSENVIHNPGRKKSVCFMEKKKPTKKCAISILYKQKLAYKIGDKP